MRFGCLTSALNPEAQEGAVKRHKPPFRISYRRTQRAESSFERVVCVERRFRSGSEDIRFENGFRRKNQASSQICDYRSFRLVSISKGRGLRPGLNDAIRLAAVFFGSRDCRFVPTLFCLLRRFALNDRPNGSVPKSGRRFYYLRAKRMTSIQSPERAPDDRTASTDPFPKARLNRIHPAWCSDSNERTVLSVAAEPIWRVPHLDESGVFAEHAFARIHSDRTRNAAGVMRDRRQRH